MDHNHWNTCYIMSMVHTQNNMIAQGAVRQRLLPSKGMLQTETERLDASCALCQRGREETGKAHNRTCRLTSNHFAVAAACRQVHNQANPILQDAMHA